MKVAAVCSAILTAILVFTQPRLHAWQEPMDHDHHDMGHDMSSMAVTQQQPSPERLAKEEADKRFSEFNHRFAGIFVMLAGLLTLLAYGYSKRAPLLRYLWAAFFFIPGVYLFIYSDPESWPVGDQTLYHVITVNHQVLQHKIFALLLLALGIVEFLRVYKNLRALWTVAAFPILAGAGALLLLFHPHPMAPGMEMDHAAHLSMMHVEHQHWGFSAVGFGIALSKAIVDGSATERRVWRNIFALLLVTLGVLLLFYSE